MDPNPTLPLQMQRRLAARAADLRAVLSVDGSEDPTGDLEAVRRQKARARLQSLVRAALADGGKPADVLDALLAGDPGLGEADAAELIDGGDALLREARQRRRRRAGDAG